MTSLRFGYSNDAVAKDCRSSWGSNCSGCSNLYSPPAPPSLTNTFDMSNITPSLGLPAFKGSTVRTSILNAGALVMPSSALVQPQISGHEIIEAPIYSFLVENERMGKKVLFDLGMMKSWKEKLPQCTSRHCPSSLIAPFRVRPACFSVLSGRFSKRKNPWH